MSFATLSFLLAGSERQLREETERFADDLTLTARAVTPDCDPFEAQVVGKRVKVRQSPKEGINLHVEGAPLLTLKADFSCTWDSRGRFLTVESSSIGVHPGGKAGKQPLFRYEYERNARTVPAAHMHVHAHRDAFTFTMTKVGSTSRRAKDRGSATVDEIPSLQQLHFPLGGHRFRPALEDVLEMLIDEFGVDCEPQAREILRDSRARWRFIQTKAAVRDAPGAAVESLRDLGFTVEYPDEGVSPERHSNRLRAL